MAATTSKELKKAKGGKRPGAGMPKGYVTRKTLDKIAGREMVRQYVMGHMDKMLRAQVANACGLSHLFVRDKDGRFVKIEDEAMIEVALNSGEEGKAYWLFTKDPSVQAFSDLANRALDKPKEQEQEVTIKLTTELKEMPGDRLAAELEALRGKLQASKAMAKAEREDA